MKTSASPRKRRLTLSACGTLGLVAGGLALSGLSWQTGPVAVQGAGFDLTVGSVRVPLQVPLQALLPRFAATAFGQTGTLSADDLTLSTADATYVVKHIELSNTALSRADLLAVFDNASKTPFSARLAKLTAGAATIPELVVETKIGQPTRIVYRNVKLTAINQGVVGTLKADGVMLTTSSPSSGDVKGTYGATEMKSLDLPTALRVFAEDQPVGGDAGKLLYDSFSIKDIRITSTKADVDATIASISGGATRLRAASANAPAATVGAGGAASAVAAATKALTSNAKPGAQPAADTARRLNDTLALLDIGPVEVKDFKGTATSKDKTSSYGAARAFVTAVSGGKVGDAGIESVHVEEDGGYVKIATVAARGVDLSASLDTLRHAGDDAIKRMRSGEVTFSGIDVSVPQEKAGAAGLAGNTAFQIAKIAVSGADSSGDARSLRVTVGMDHLTAALNLSPDSDFKDLAEMGYSKLDVSTSLGFAWNAGTKDLTIDDISINGVDMGKAKLAASIANVDGDLFSGDTARVQAAALVMIAKKLELRLDNAGFFEKEIALQARRQNKSPDEVRQQFVQMAALGIPAFLGSDPGAKSIAAALAKFIANPKSLRVTATAPTGFGASDLPLIHEPADVLRKLEISAAANE